MNLIEIRNEIEDLMLETEAISNEIEEAHNDALHDALETVLSRIKSIADDIRNNFEDQLFDARLVNKLTDEELYLLHYGANDAVLDNDSNDYIYFESVEQGIISLARKKNVLKIGEEEWFTRYQPLDADGNSAKNWDNVEWYDRVGDVPFTIKRWTHVWCDTDYDGDIPEGSTGTFLQSGYHSVNVFRYCITENPCENYQTVQVHWETS